MKLSEVQAKLKAPKGQTNTFGKYKYRSCEDILESLKPVLSGKASITITDEIALVGDRYYIKATATFKSDEEEVSVTGFAREAENKKGMDASQITGATSSYARKYALNGLFAIDDTKDADTKDNSKEGQFNETHQQKLDSINTTEALKQYWEANQFLGSAFGKAITARKKQIEDIENATKDV
jgi:hypothetical protein